MPGLRRGRRRRLPRRRVLLPARRALPTDDLFGLGRRRLRDRHSRNLRLPREHLRPRRNPRRPRPLHQRHPLQLRRDPTRRLPVPRPADHRPAPGGRGMLAHPRRRRSRLALRRGDRAVEYPRRRPHHELTAVFGLEGDRRPPGSPPSLRGRHHRQRCPPSLDHRCPGPSIARQPRPDLRLMPMPVLGEPDAAAYAAADAGAARSSWFPPRRRGGRQDARCSGLLTRTATSRRVRPGAARCRHDPASRRRRPAADPPRDPDDPSPIFLSRSNHRSGRLRKPLRPRAAFAANNSGPELHDDGLVAWSGSPESRARRWQAKLGDTANRRPAAIHSSRCAIYREQPRMMKVVGTRRPPPTRCPEPRWRSRAA